MLLKELRALVASFPGRGRLHRACKCYVTAPQPAKLVLNNASIPYKSMLGDRRSAEKTNPLLSDPQYLLKCDALSCEGAAKTVRTSLRRNEELCQVRDFSPSMLLYGALPLFRTNFSRCHALLSFVTSSLASPIDFFLLWNVMPSSLKASVLLTVEAPHAVVF